MIDNLDFKIYNKTMRFGIVVKKLADKFWVKSQNETFCCNARGNLKSKNIFVGDKVEFKDNTIEKVSQRTNLLVRPPVANMDQLIITISALPKPDFLLVDKLLIFCQVNGIKPVICVNKVDLESKDIINYVEKTYVSCVEKIIYTSIKENTKEQLLDILENKLSAFAGQSAVGKSALIKYLIPDANIISGELSKKIGRGKQTTRHCEIFQVAENSFVVDTAGFTSLDEKLLPIPYFELGYYYLDFIQFLPECKYKSCLHSAENDCAIKDAVKQGKIDKGRYQRYLLILNSLKELWVKSHG